MADEERSIMCERVLVSSCNASHLVAILKLSYEGVAIAKFTVSAVGVNNLSLRRGKVPFVTSYTQLTNVYVSQARAQGIHHVQ